jgi:hypothetical protein
MIFFLLSMEGFVLKVAGKHLYAIHLKSYKWISITEIN